MSNGVNNVIFQSTLSVRRATRLLSPDVLSMIISIHALREESDRDTLTVLGYVQISIHALREESDFDPFITSDIRQISIHALREESDCPHRGRYSGTGISIHALREESDSQSDNCIATPVHFNPRSP